MRSGLPKDGRLRPPGYEMLKQFCRNVEAGETPKQETLNFLAAAFHQLMEAQNTDTGLRKLGADLELIGDRTGRPVDQELIWRNFNLACMVHYHKLADGLNLPAAKKRVAEKSGCVVKTVERALDKYDSCAARFMVDMLVHEPVVKKAHEIISAMVLECDPALKKAHEIISAMVLEHPDLLKTIDKSQT